MKQLSQASKTALGGMTVALSVVLLIPTAVDLFVYALPAIAGFLTLFCVIEFCCRFCLFRTKKPL